MIQEDYQRKRDILRMEKEKLQEEVDLMGEEEQIDLLKEKLKNAKRKRNPLNKWLKRINEKFGRY